MVRNAALFALGQFSENLQPHISNYSGEVMPLLLAYLKSVRPGHTQHLAKACYALENFVENLGNGGSRERGEGLGRRGRVSACSVASEEPSGWWARRRW